MAQNWNRIGDGSGARNMGANLARMLLGHREGAEDAYRQRLGDNIALGRSDQALQQDIMKTDARRDGLRNAAIANGHTPAQADLIAANAQGESGGDYLNTVKGIGETLTQGYRGNAIEALRQGDYMSGNAYLAGIHGQPLKVSDVSGDVIHNPYAPPSMNTFTPTAIGAAREAQARASATNSLTQTMDLPGGIYNVDIGSNTATPVSVGGGGGIGGQGGDVFASLFEAVPGIRVTSRWRTPEQNRRAGGVANSRHLHGDGLDIGRPTPEQAAGIRRWAQANGFRIKNDYADGHWHLEPDRNTEIGRAVLQRSGSGGGSRTLQGKTAQSGRTENAPSGYRWAGNGGLEAIPGGPADKRDEPRFQLPNLDTLGTMIGPDREREFVAWQQRQAAVDPAYNDPAVAIARFMSGQVARGRNAPGPEWTDRSRVAEAISDARAAVKGGHTTAQVAVQRLQRAGLYEAAEVIAKEFTQ